MRRYSSARERTLPVAAQVLGYVKNCSRLCSGSASHLTIQSAQKCVRVSGWTVVEVYVAKWRCKVLPPLGIESIAPSGQHCPPSNTNWVRSLSASRRTMTGSLQYFLMDRVNLGTF